MVLVYADSLPDGEDLLLRVLDQNDMILLFHKFCSLHMEDVILELMDQRPPGVQLPQELQPPLAQERKQPAVLQFQHRPDFPQGKPIALQPLNFYQVGQLLLTVVAVAVPPHRLRAEKAQGVVVAEHPWGDPAQPGKLADGEHGIPPYLLWEPVPGFRINPDTVGMSSIFFSLLWNPPAPCGGTPL